MVIDKHLTKILQILTDVDNEIKIRAEIRGACFRERVICTKREGNIAARIIDSMNIPVEVFAWNSGNNNNHQIRVVPDAGVVADVLEARLLKSHFGHVTNVGGIFRFIVLGAIPRNSSITTAGILLGPSRCGEIPEIPINNKNGINKQNNNAINSHTNNNSYYNGKIDGNSNSESNKMNNNNSNNVNNNEDSTNNYDYNDIDNDDDDSVNTISVLDFNFDGVVLSKKPLSK